MAEPPPLRVTFGTGQPKFMSMWSAMFSSTIIFAARYVYSGSVVYSCMLRGFSSGAKVVMWRVFSLRSTSARAVIISQT